MTELLTRIDSPLAVVAKALGVAETTVRRDLSDGTATHVAPDEESTGKNDSDESQSATHVAPGGKYERVEELFGIAKRTAEVWAHVAGVYEPTMRIVGDLTFNHHQIAASLPKRDGAAG